MEPQGYKEFVSREIKKLIVDLRQKGVKTSKGEPMSMAAIGRTVEPPVTRTAVQLVVEGKSESRSIKDAVERELGRVFWMRRKAA